MPAAPAKPSERANGSTARPSASRARIDGAPAGQDRRRRGPERAAHRLVPVLHVPQLLAVPGDQQQRVVGAGAEHQHRDDPGDGAVGAQVGDPAEDGEQLGGDLVAEADDGERAPATATGCGR